MVAVRCPPLSWGDAASIYVLSLSLSLSLSLPLSLSVSLSLSLSLRLSLSLSLSLRRALSLSEWATDPGEGKLIERHFCVFTNTQPGEEEEDGKQTNKQTNKQTRYSHKRRQVLNTQNGGEPESAPCWPLPCAGETRWCRHPGHVIREDDE